MKWFFVDVEEACAGRRWWVRAPAVPFFSYVWLRHATDPLYHSVFGGLNLGVHELGHFVFGPFGDVLGALGGSLLQCLLPFVGMAMFLRQRDVFAVTFAWGWLATNLFEVATYAGDAVAMRLPLVTPGGGHAIHDWNYVLGALGWLRHTSAVADALRLGANASMALGLGGMIWLLMKMKRDGGRISGTERRSSETGLAGRLEDERAPVSPPRPAVARSPTGGKARETSDRAT